MIGTILRLGFDATAIQRGLAGLGGLFGRATRQIGIGGLRQVGAQMTDFLGRVITALPMAGKEMLDWAGNMTDMSAQTGISIQRLLVMEEALRMTGASAADTSRMMSVLNDNLFEASKGSEAQKEALNKLGFAAQDLVDMPLDDAFLAIGKAVADLPSDFKGLESIMADLFGARMGYKMIRFFKDLENSMGIARKNVSSFNDVSDNTFTNFDNISDIMGRWAMTRRSLLAGLFEGIAGESGIKGAASSLDGLFDKLNRMSDTMRSIGYELRAGLSEALEVIGQQGIMASLGDLFTNLGKNIGKGIMESVKESINISPAGFMKFLKNPFASNTGSDGLLKETSKQTTILSRIERKGITATYA